MQALRSSSSSAGRARTSITTSAESTLGAGSKAAAGRWSASLASLKSWTATVEVLAPVPAVQRSATSRCTTRLIRLGRGGRSSSRGRRARQVVAGALLWRVGLVLWDVRGARRAPPGPGLAAGVPDAARVAGDAPAGVHRPAEAVALDVEVAAELDHRGIDRDRPRTGLG